MDKNKAIKIIKELHTNCDSSVTIALETLLPEVFETEDEEIKKEITRYFEVQSKEVPFRKEIHDKWISWIQKQGEQKHKFNIGNIISNGQVVYRVDNIVKNCIGQDCYFLVNVEAEKNGAQDLMVDFKGEPFRYGEITWLCEQVDKSFEKKELKAEPLFNVDDWVVDNDCGKVKQVSRIEKNGYGFKNGDYSSFESAAKSYHTWTIQEAKDGDVLVTKNCNIFIFKSIKGHTVYDYCGLYFGRFESEKGTPNGTGATELPDDYKPATKEQRDLLFAKMKEAGYEWDAEKKELKKISNSLEECKIDHIEHGHYYYCIKDYYSGGCKRASKGEVVKALRGLDIMGLGVEANEYFLPVKRIVNDEAHEDIWHSADEEPTKDDVLVLVELVEPMEGEFLIDLLRYNSCTKNFHKFGKFFISKDKICRWAYVEDIVKEKFRNYAV